MRRPAVVPALITVGVLSVSLTACGGQDKVARQEPASKAPSPSSPSSPSAAPTTSDAAASPTPSGNVESQPQVVAARAWDTAFSHDVSNGDRNYALSKPLSTQKAQGYLGDFGNSDIEARLVYPGPVPFTVVGLRSGAALAKVATCMQLKGWAQDPTTYKIAQPTEITGTYIVMRKVGADWKFDDLRTSSAIDCDGVNVRGTPW